MNAQVIHLDPVRIVMLRHTGSYDGIGPVFEQLWGWVESHNVPVQRTIGIYWDNPDEVPVNKLRSAACVEIPSDYQVTDSGGLSLILDQLAPAITQCQLTLDHTITLLKSGQASPPIAKRP